MNALGTRLRVAVQGMPQSVVDALRDQWSRLASDGETTDVLSVGSAGDPAADVSGRDLDEVGIALRRAINQRAVLAGRGELVTFHAAGLADPVTGDVIALVGPSGAGKSTAAAALGTALGYVSDETVAVASSGEVIAFPQPLAFKRSVARGKHVVGPDELGLLRPGPRLRLTRIALLDRTEDATTPTVETVGLGTVLGDLVEQINYFSALPAPLTLLDRLVRRCGGVHVIGYSEAGDLVGPVRELLRTAAEGATYSRAEVDDWVDLDGGAVVHARDTITRLTPLSSLVWRLLDVPLTLPRLVAQAEREFGPAPGGNGADAVRGVLRELEDVGLVRSSGGRHRARG